MRRILLAIAASGVLFSAQAMPTQTEPNQNSVAMNDSDMTAKVREAFMNDSKLGEDAIDVRVTTHHGLVTLRGKVKSQEQKDALIAKAKQVAGDANVKDALSVTR